VEVQVLVLVKEDLVVVQEHMKIIQAVVLVVVIQEAPHQTTEQIMKAVAVVLSTLEPARLIRKELTLVMVQ
jgi:hypothetical protein